MIYLDYSANTPADSRVLERFCEVERSCPGNANSHHQAGRDAKLVIELDGSQHYEDGNMKKDGERTAFLEAYGLTVIRIPNNEVSRNFCGVCEYIDSVVKQSLSQLR